MEKQRSWYQILKRERQLRGWSQEKLAEKINSNQRTVGRWERNESFPDTYNRQQLIETFGKNAEELGFLPHIEEELASGTAAPSQDIPQQDWGEAPQVEDFYGRSKELATLQQWISDDQCRMVAILGLGGNGKTTVTYKLTQKIQTEFQYIFWRSLQNAPPIREILEKCILFFAKQQSIHIPDTIDDQISLLITYLIKEKCLLVLDNFEAVLQEGKHAGQYREEYRDYGKLLLRVGEAAHQSCLVITSREKPRELSLLEGTPRWVHSMQLPGVETIEGQNILKSENLLGSDNDWEKLVHNYSGNPLALKLISEPISEVFNRDIAAFLSKETTVFGDVEDLIAQQFERLSDIEKAVMYWLAIEREALTLDRLQEHMTNLTANELLIEAIHSLRRRFMLEKSSKDGYFTLQPVIMAYATKHLIEQIYREIVTMKAFRLFSQFPLMQAQAKDYIRRSQLRLILLPLGRSLLATFGKIGSEKQLKELLLLLQATQREYDSYAAGNLLNLLISLHADLRDTDFSHLVVRQAYLQGKTLPEVNFSHADLSTSVFTDIFSSILCAATSPDGNYFVTGTTTGEVRLWSAKDITPLFDCVGHASDVRSVAFSRDSSIIASGSEDETIRLWHTATGECLNTLQGHTSIIRAVAFNYDGTQLASCSEDKTIRLWDVSTGKCRQILQEHTQCVRTLAFNPTTNMLASGSDDQTIRLWKLVDTTYRCLHVLHEHTALVRTLVFNADGSMLASGSEDQTIRLWSIAEETVQCTHVLRGHTSRIRCMVFAPVGNMLISGSDDQTIRLWDIDNEAKSTVLNGHKSRIWSVAPFPKTHIFLSASEDDTLRLWDMQTSQCLKILEGYSFLVKSVAFSPDGQTLVSGSEDQRIQLWNIATGRCLKTFTGHTHRVRSVAFSKDGRTIASGSEDETVRIWDVVSGNCRKILSGHTHLLRSIAYSADGNKIASGSFDGTIRIWDSNTGSTLNVLAGHDGQVSCVAFSPDGNIIASGGADQTIHLWNTSGECLGILSGHTHWVWSVAFGRDSHSIVSSGDDKTIRLWDIEHQRCLTTLSGHTGWVRSVAFSADNTLIVSGSHDHSVRLWSTASGDCLATLSGHQNCIWTVAFSPTEPLVASGSDDGTIKLWNVQTNQCIQTLHDERPYDSMNIAHAKGLTPLQRTSLKLLGAIEKDSDSR